MMPTIRPCKCGATPALTEQARYGINVIRIECACGNRGATLMFTKPADADRMRQAAIDGWNLAG